MGGRCDGDRAVARSVVEQHLHDTVNARYEVDHLRGFVPWAPMRHQSGSIDSFVAEERGGALELPTRGNRATHRHLARYETVGIDRGSREAADSREHDCRTRGSRREHL